jgi:hypothetical protein
VSAIGRTIRLFLVDGSPNGVLTAEIMNWTGHVLSAPRSGLIEVLRRPEAGRTGVYFLVGSDPERLGQSLVYIGESDNVGERLTQHNRREDRNFWEATCVVTNKDANLTKAHVKYLESRLIKLTTLAGRARLINETAPEFGYLPESDISDMEYFISQLLTLLPVLGFDFLRTTPQFSSSSRQDIGDVTGASDAITDRPEKNVFARDRPTAEGGRSPIFQLSDYHENVSAKAVEIDGQMVILRGSEAREQELPSLASNVKLVRQQLLQSGKLAVADKPGVLRFTEDVAFSSPSAAAQAVMGSSRNGRTDWKTEKTGQTYAAWQEAQIANIRQSESGFEA